jgi:hypothetical protein
VSLTNVSNAVVTPYSIYHAVLVSVAEHDDIIYISLPEVSNDDTDLGKVLVDPDAIIIIEDLTVVRKPVENLACVRTPM